MLVVVWCGMLMLDGGVSVMNFGGSVVCGLEVCGCGIVEEVVWSGSGVMWGSSSDGVVVVVV